MAIRAVSPLVGGRSGLIVSTDSTHPVRVSGSFNSTFTAEVIFAVIGGNRNYQVFK